MTIELSKQDLEILIEFLPPSYKDDTHEAVKELKLRLMKIQEEQS